MVTVTKKRGITVISGGTAAQQIAKAKELGADTSASEKALSNKSGSSSSSSRSSGSSGSSSSSSSNQSRSTPTFVELAQKQIEKQQEQNFSPAPVQEQIQSSSSNQSRSTPTYVEIANNQSRSSGSSSSSRSSSSSSNQSRSTPTYVEIAQKQSQEQNVSPAPVREKIEQSSSSNQSRSTPTYVEIANKKKQEQNISHAPSTMLRVDTPTQEQVIRKKTFTTPQPVQRQFLQVNDDKPDNYLFANRRFIDAKRIGELELKKSRNPQKFSLSLSQVELTGRQASSQIFTNIAQVQAGAQRGMKFVKENPLSILPSITMSPALSLFPAIKKQETNLLKETLFPEKPVFRQDIFKNVVSRGNPEKTVGGLIALAFDFVPLGKPKGIVTAIDATLTPKITFIRNIETLNLIDKGKSKTIQQVIQSNDDIFVKSLQTKAVQQQQGAVFEVSSPFFKDQFVVAKVSDIESVAKLQGRTTVKQLQETDMFTATGRADVRVESDIISMPKKQFDINVQQQLYGEFKYNDIPKNFLETTQKSRPNIAKSSVFIDQRIRDVTKPTQTGELRLFSAADNLLYGGKQGTGGASTEFFTSNRVGLRTGTESQKLDPTLLGDIAETKGSFQKEISKITETQPKAIQINDDLTYREVPEFTKTTRVTQLESDFESLSPFQSQFKPSDVKPYGYDTGSAITYKDLLGTFNTGKKRTGKITPPQIKSIPKIEAPTGAVTKQIIKPITEKINIPNVVVGERFPKQSSIRGRQRFSEFQTVQSPQVDFRQIQSGARLSQRTSSATKLTSAYTNTQRTTMPKTSFFRPQASKIRIGGKIDEFIDTRTKFVDPTPEVPKIRNPDTIVSFVPSIPVPKINQPAIITGFVPSPTPPPPPIIFIPPYIPNIDKGGQGSFSYRRPSADIRKGYTKSLLSLTTLGKTYSKKSGARINFDPLFARF